MKKKLISLMLCLAMLVTMLAACGEKVDPTDAPKPTDPPKATEAPDKPDATEAPTEPEIPEGKSSMWLIGNEESAELSMLLRVSPTDKDPADMWFFKYYEEMTGVHMNVSAVQDADMADKKSVIMATGEYPGIIFEGNWTSEEILRYADEGSFLDLTDYIQYMPNYKALMDSIPGAWDAVTCPDGGMYSIAKISNASRLTSVNQTMWINGRWLKNLGLETPETLDDFYQVLKAFKEKDADGDGDTEDEIPWITRYSMTSQRCRSQMFNAFGFDTDGGYIALENYNNSNPVFVPLTERYKEYLVFMNKLYEEGLLDQDMFSQDGTAVEAKMTEQSSGAFGGLPYGTANPNFADFNRIVLKYDEKADIVTYKANPVGMGSIVITDNCEDPVLAAKWIDLFFAPENAFNIPYGPIILEYPDGKLEYVSEGVTEDPAVGGHVMVDADGNYLRLAYPNQPEGMSATDYLKPDHPFAGMFNQCLGETDMLNALFKGRPSTKELYVAQQKARYENESENETNRAYGWMYSQDAEIAFDYAKTGVPTVYPSADQQQWLTENEQIITDYVIQMEAQFITGAKDIEAEYDAFMAELKAKGAEELQKIYQDLIK